MDIASQLGEEDDSTRVEMRRRAESSRAGILFLIAQHIAQLPFPNAKPHPENIAMQIIAGDSRQSSAGRRFSNKKTSFALIESLQVAKTKVDAAGLRRAHVVGTPTRCLTSRVGQRSIWRIDHETEEASRGSARVSLSVNKFIASNAIEATRLSISGKTSPSPSRGVPFLWEPSQGGTKDAQLESARSVFSRVAHSCARQLFYCTN